MPNKSTNIDPVREVPIEEIIGNYIELRKDGSGLKALCPFHDEKTPSFKINLKTNRYTCYGCGEHGDGIDFVMRLKGLDYMDAVESIAKDHGITVNWNGSAASPQHQEKKNRLHQLNALGAKYYTSQLWASAGAKALEFALSRWDEETLKEWGIGYAPSGWTSLVDFAKEKGFPVDELKEAGLASESKGRVFDVYRNRLVFPISNKNGQPVGFTCRAMEPDHPKYINTKETLVYKKGELLFGLDRAQREIRDQNEVILVEGAPDVIRLHAQHIYNVVAPLGTSLTDEQVKLIKDRAESVLIIPDSDEAGEGAMHRNAEKLIRQGLFVTIALLPGEGKQDPDSYFRENNFVDFAQKARINYLIYRANTLKDEKLEGKQKGIQQLAALINCYPESAQELFTEDVGKIVKSKNSLKKAMAEVALKEKKNQPAKEIIPEGVNPNDFEVYGFYSNKNQLFFRTNNKGIQRGANFILIPLYHIESTYDAKRIFVIVNEFGHERIIEFSQRDLISLQAFKLKVESLGNFLWELGEAELGKLKKYLYEKTDTCLEIKQLGWQKQGLWAWGNGVYDPETGEYKPVNDHGIADHKGKKYYLPAFSRIYEKDHNLYASEREFIHRPGSVALRELIERLNSVFGINSQVMFAYLVAALFRDIIVSRFGYFPILNIFGPKGTGKTELAWIFLQFFGKLPRGINLSGSKPSIADHVAHRANSLSHLEEYKNNLDFEKIEFMKGIYDNTGRTRMNMEKDRKKETTAVDSGVILTGQEMPTVDIALFSRLIFLTFSKTEFDESEKKAFSQLKGLAKGGFSHLTHQILSHRSYFAENFFDNYQNAEKEIEYILGNEVIEARIQNNWTILVAAFRTLEEKLQTGINYDQFLRESVQLIRRQNGETKQGDDVANFWKIFKFLVANQVLTDGVDFRIKEEEGIATARGPVDFGRPTRLLMLNHTRTFQEYLKHGSATRTNVLPLRSLEYYLTSSKEFIGKSKGARFQYGAGSFKDYVTTALVFRYDLLIGNYDLSLEDPEEKEAGNARQPETTAKNEELPF